jgi:hypothetical protein
MGMVFFNLVGVAFGAALLFAIATREAGFPLRFWLAVALAACTMLLAAT